MDFFEVYAVEAVLCSDDWDNAGDVVVLLFSIWPVYAYLNYKMCISKHGISKNMTLKSVFSKIYLLHLLKFN